MALPSLLIPLICLTVLVSSINSESTATLTATPLSATSLQEIEVAGNDSAVNVPFRPGQRPRFSIMRKSVGSQRIVAGALSHHLFWITNQFWLIDSSDHLTGVTQYRNEHFPDVVTTLSVVRRRKQMTPFNLARGFDRLLDTVLRSQDWTDQYYDWLFGNYLAGSTKTELSGANLMAPYGAKASFQGNSSASYTSNFRVRFTGTPMPAWKFLCVFRELMERMWAYSASGSIFELAHEHSALIIEDPSTAPHWTLRFEFRVSDERAQTIHWSTVTGLILELLQLPASTNHWETLACDLFADQVRFAEIKLSTGSGNFDTSPPAVQEAYDQTNLTSRELGTFAV